ncbi:glutamate ABC transporter substrate-binding protein [Kitasatospora sp. MAA4]|uniref:glutamate ABC transporter substrate-binding protein n=1 Tax=Kitasatospora sp. MAA4 TaxID=3035093 RepID=UPI0024772D4E|nr:glutamate ABC transporter substrate-binding protein [Kitasatospora sp. MAA4]
MARTRTRIRSAVLAAALLVPLTLTMSASAQSGAGGVRMAAAPVLAPGATPTCDPTKSVRPSLDESGPAVSAIKRRGVLIAGVDQNSYRWGFRDPASGQLEGFDIDLVHAVAKAILGDPNKVQFKTVPTDQRINAIKNGQVDLIARTMSITCDRLNDVAFSTAYFEAGQQVVVPRSARATGIDQALKGKTVCVADSSTAQTELKSNQHGAAKVRVVGNQLDCLVLMQLGQVDATMTDNALAVGQAAQDPTVQVIGPSLTSEPYGIAMAKGATDLVARVNQVLADYRQSGWQASYDKWLGPYLGPSNGPPPANYLP